MIAMACEYNQILDPLDEGLGADLAYTLKSQWDKSPTKRVMKKVGLVQKSPEEKRADWLKQKNMLKKASSGAYKMRGADVNRRKRGGSVRMAYT